MNDVSLWDDGNISTESDLRTLFSDQHPLAAQKCRPGLDRHCRDFIARSPFLCLGTQNADGTADVSPRGDAPGFTRIIDDTTLVIPDRPGNNRLDSLTNILSNPSVGLLFIVPGFDDTLRVNGQATLNRNPDLLATMAVSGRAPKLAIIVRVSEAFMHCAKAFRRSGLWDPAARQDRSEMPSLARIILDQTTGVPEDDGEMKKIEQEIEEDYKQTMY